MSAAKAAEQPKETPKTAIELKAQAYDLIAEMEFHQNQIQRVQKLLAEKNQEIAALQNKPEAIEARV